MLQAPRYGILQRPTDISGGKLHQTQINWQSIMSQMSILEPAPIFLKMCSFQCIAGAWCTTARMHSPCTWDCIFGCIDAREEVVHYLSCPILWHFAREILKIREDSIFLGSRLCLVGRSISKLKLIAFVHSLYHALMNEVCIMQVCV